MRWRLAMIGDRKQKAEIEDGIQDLSHMLASKDAKIRALEGQVSYGEKTPRHFGRNERQLSFKS